MGKAKPEWRRPRACFLASCIEVQFIGKNTVKIRRNQGRSIIVNKDEFQKFIQAIKNGEFDC